MNIIRNIFSKKITINNESNLIIVNIKESCSLQEYMSILKRTKYSNLLNIIDLKHLLTTNTILPKRILAYKLTAAPKTYAHKNNMPVKSHGFPIVNFLLINQLEI